MIKQGRALRQAIPNKSAKDKSQQSVLVKKLNGALLIIGLEHLHSLFNKLAAQSFFSVSRKSRITNRIRNGDAGQNSVDTDHLSDVRNSGDLNGRNTNFFDLSCNR